MTLLMLISSNIVFKYCYYLLDLLEYNFYPLLQFWRCNVFLSVFVMLKENLV